MERDQSPYERSLVQGGVQQGCIRSGNKDKGETRTRGNILGQDWIRVSGSCVRTGSDREAKNKQIYQHVTVVCQRAIFAPSKNFDF